MPFSTSRHVRAHIVAFNLMDLLSLLNPTQSTQRIPLFSNLCIKQMSRLLYPRQCTQRIPNFSSNQLVTLFVDIFTEVFVNDALQHIQTCSSTHCCIQPDGPAQSLESNTVNLANTVVLKPLYQTDVSSLVPKAVYPANTELLKQLASYPVC